MYRPLPLMFTVAWLASTAALAEPASHESRYQQHGQPNAGAHQDRGQRPAYAAARPAERGAGWAGSYRDPRASGRAARQDFPRQDLSRAYPPRRELPSGPAREAARSQAYAPARNGWGNGWRGADRPAGSDRRGDGGPYASRYGSSDNRYPNNDRYRSTGWSRDRDEWRDGGGRGWDHDRDWYQRYRNDHFRFFGDRYYARQRFEIGFYEAPWGYAPRLWVYGDRLPYAYYGARYLVDDYYDYDLYAPPYGAEWVRVGNDVLLVDMQSGEVLDVVANLFW